jgi:hypothetical protein
MCKKLVMLGVAILVAVPAITNAASIGPVGWWKFDETSGKVAADSSGNGLNGALLPASAGPVWVTGKLNGALQFNGSTDCVDLGNKAAFNMAGSFTVSLWANIGAWTSGWGCVMMGNRGEDNIGWQIRRYSSDRLCFTTRGQGNDDVSSNLTPVPQNQWIHIGCVYNSANNTKAIYVNGLLDKSVSTNGASVTPTTHNTYIGARANNTNATQESFFTGILDDVRLYDRALSGDDLTSTMTGGIGYGVANTPTPANTATNVLCAQPLSWTAGPGAVSHNVYFGTNAANLTLVGSAQAGTTFNPGRLDFNTKYYWRVDEVQADSSVIAGNPWSFTTEVLAAKITAITVKASSYVAASDPNKTIDNSGIDASDLAGTDVKTMWSTDSKVAGPVWIQYTFDRIYKMYEMWVWNYNSGSEADLGYGFMNTTVEYSIDGLTWTKLNDYVFEDGTSEAGYAHNTTIVFGGVAAKMVKLTAKDNYGGLKTYGLSEVRFYQTPAFATTPSPATGATAQRPDLTLGWRPGRGAVTHNIYIGTDPNNLTLVGSIPANSVSPTFTPTGLQLGNPVAGVTYYWRVDEVNDAEVTPVMSSALWSFTTVTSIVVDNMESYTNDMGAGKAIFQTWIDGYGTTRPNANGSTVGYLSAPFAETAIARSGAQSMPFFYDNTLGVTVSEATRTFATPQDWTIGGITTLVMFVRPDPGNTISPKLYVKINSTQVSFPGTLTTSPVPVWSQWNIDLTKLTGLNAVKSLTIGVSGAGSGLLYIDDIVLYKTPPAVPHPVDPGTTGLAAYYTMSDNVTDSSGNGNDGVIVGAPTFAAGLAPFGKALNLNGTTDCVDLGKKDVWNPTGAFSISLWANIGAWGTAWGHVMVGHRGEDNVGWQVRRGAGTGLCFTTRGQGNDDTTGSAPLLGQWIHIVCVYDNVSNTKTIYFNGAQNLTVNTTAGAKITPATQDAYIGARSNSGNTGPESFFTGMLDEIRFYTRVLTADEVYYLAGGK